MAENTNAERSAPAGAPIERAPTESVVSEIQKNPDALKDLAKNPEFVRSLDALKSNPVVKEALDKAWNASLVSLFRNGFEGAPPEKQAEMIRALSENERTILVFHVRSYDRDNGSDLPPVNPNDPESLRAVAASMRRSIEMGKNAETLKKSDLKGRFDGLKTGADKDVSAMLEKMDVATMTEKDVSKLRAAGVDLSKLFLMEGGGSPCQGKDAIVKASLNAKEGQPGQKFVVDFGKNDKVNRAVGAGDILPDEVERVKINGTEGTKKFDPRPGFYDQNGKYLPIFDGYTIEVLSSKELSEADRKAALDAHARRFEEIVSDDVSDMIREAMTADHMLVKAESPAEAGALANVLATTLGITDAKGVEGLKNQLLGEGVDLGKQGPHAAKIAEFHQKMAQMSLERGGRPAGVPMGGISSGPAERSQTGSTLCSKTARENAERIFGVSLRRGDAIDVQNSYGPTGLRQSSDPSRSPTEISAGLPPSDPKANFADVFTGSKSEYGHRCVAFKKNDAWYVLDPYVNKTTDPVPLAQYPRAGQIRKAALYTLPA
ncbi:MAG: hypothetical protein QG650_613 [Patescibacteria group bacterium]|nr:hypothetical protein [Patescibacteria group bacterium]